MNNHSIERILREGALLLKHDFDPSVLRFIEINNRSYSRDQFAEFRGDLVEAGSKVRVLFLERSIAPANVLTTVAKEAGSVTLVFMEESEGPVPVLLYEKDGAVGCLAIGASGAHPLPASKLTPQKLHLNTAGQLPAFTLYPYESLVSDYAFDGDPPPGQLSPVKRFIRLLSTERRDIFYIFIYSLVIGLTSLILPVGIQTTVQLVSGGVFFSSVYILIAAVILGVLFTGILQIIQITLVEYVQRRVFAKAALEFAFRIPRIRMESILRTYAPELVNRFFDVITLQKGLPKLLIELVSSGVQILFGLILLSLYHPTFVFFSLALILSLFLIFWFTGPAGLRSSLDESKYKYKVVQWLEELARALNSFKLAGNTDLPIRKADNTVNSYLKYRKAHFRILVTQFSFLVVFKTAVTASLLILGTILVVDRQITLGQFVASEVIIVLILSSVEKLIASMDVVYDLLTAVDKVSQVTDIPLEKAGGLTFPRIPDTGYSVDIRKLRYRYPGAPKDVLKDIDMTIASGEKLCISGPGNAGKTTLTNLIAGIHSGHEGIITINNYSVRDLDLRHLRNSIAKNISPEGLFDGTILDNITLGSPARTVSDAINAIRRVKLEDEINQLPEGLNTHVVSGGKGLSSSFVHKLILARCLAKNPALIILNDFFPGLKRQEKLDLLHSVIHEVKTATLVAVSNDPLVMAACDRVVLLYDGKILDEGPFPELLKRGTISNYIE